MATDEIIWRPDPEAAARTRMGRFMAAHGLATLADLQRRSMADPEWYWDAVSRDLAFHWFTPYRRVLDTSKGIEWPRWFEGGRLNLADNSVDCHIAAGRGDKLAVIAEAEDGTVRTLSYRELAAEVGRLANALKRLGIRPGDTVGILLPMCAEAVIATLAVVRIGAAYTPCFSGYGAQAVASRLDGCGARLLITADTFARRGQPIPLKRTADEAVSACPSVEHVIVHRRSGAEVPWKDGRDLWWHDLVAAESAECPALPVEADHPCLIIYTSGTTGRPKGTVLTHGGFSIKNAHDFAYLFDLGESDRLFWVTVLGISPTAVRALMPHGAEWVTRHDLSSLKLMASTGEPWNPEPYR